MKKGYRVLGYHCCILHRLNECVYADCSTDLDHVKTRGAGGGDEEGNLMPLCRKHHVERHKIGVQSMAKKYKHYKKWLDEKEEA